MWLAEILGHLRHVVYHGLAQLQSHNNVEENNLQLVDGARIFKLSQTHARVAHHGCQETQV
jgi:hypothetical protein